MDLLRVQAWRGIEEQAREGWSRSCVPEAMMEAKDS
jgi:hypothetical protein